MQRPETEAVNLFVLNREAREHSFSVRNEMARKVISKAVRSKFQPLSAFLVFRETEWVDGWVGG